MALGAQRGSVVAMVMRRGMALVGVGTVTGLIAAYALAGVARSLLFGVAPSDPMVLGLVSTVLAAVAAVACYVPARRASKVDPLVALRQD
jgi:ABC-type antimicrobial peptide transport system permease subunit